MHPQQPNPYGQERGPHVQPQQPYAHPPQGQHPPQGPRPPYPPQLFVQQQPPPKQGHWWSGRLAIGLGAGLLGLIIGSAGASGSSTASTAVPAPAPTVTVTAPANGKPAPQVTVTAKPAPAPTVTITQKSEPPEPKEPKEGAAAFTDGQYLVGADIKPGRYRTVEVAQDTSAYLCYMDVQNDDGDYLAQELTSKGKTIVNIKKAWKGATLSSKGCGDWERI